MWEPKPENRTGVYPIAWKLQGSAVGRHAPFISDHSREMKGCALNTEHLPSPPIPRRTENVMASNHRRRMLHGSEGARYDFSVPLMLCGLSYRLRHGA